MPIYPMIFHPILKPKVWGGRYLERLGKPLPPGQPIGESWELADLPESIPDGQSIVANGPLAERTIRQVIADHREEILGDAKLTDEGGFPLLMKYLDARQNLSVQVHPDRNYVERHPEARLKSEAWYVIHAEPGAILYKGVRTDVTAEAFARHISTGEVVHDLIGVPARPGDCHYLPSGTCHALGAGIVVAEIQTPSDTTFRVYDWGRPAGSGRELHIEQALECIHFGPQPDSYDLHNRSKPYRPIRAAGLVTTQLVQTEFFEIERVECEEESQIPVVTSGLPEVWMMLEGRGQIHNEDGQKVDLLRGTTVLIPASLSAWSSALDKAAVMLRVAQPSRLRGKIA